MNISTLPAKGMTHSGKFHSDDVFSTALLLLLKPEISIERSNTVPENFDGIVYDIGLGVFDHHQVDREVRENGIPYAAFGLLWRALGPEVLPTMWEQFDKDFVQPLDLSDNTGCPHAIADAIDMFNPDWDNMCPTDPAFWEAVDVAKVILKKAFSRYASKDRARAHVEKALAEANNHMMLLPMSMPWKDYVTEDIYFVLYPSSRGGYNAQCVPISKENPAHRCNFPESWWGRSGDELRTLSGYPGLRFCHKSGFLLAGDALEDVTQACEAAIAKM